MYAPAAGAYEDDAGGCEPAIGAIGDDGDDGDDGAGAGREGDVPGVEWSEGREGIEGRDACGGAGVPRPRCDGSSTPRATRNERTSGKRS